MNMSIFADLLEQCGLMGSFAGTMWTHGVFCRLNIGEMGNDHIGVDINMTIILIH